MEAFYHFPKTTQIKNQKTSKIPWSKYIGHYQRLNLKC